jgi:hypothetical protein
MDVPYRRRTHWLSGTVEDPAVDYGRSRRREPEHTPSVDEHLRRPPARRLAEEIDHLHLEWEEES